MPTRDLENQPMAYSVLVGREVGISSEEWKHECEIAYLADMSPEKRKAILYGVQGAEGDQARGIKHHRGEVAVAMLRAGIDRYRRVSKSN